MKFETPGNDWDRYLRLEPKYLLRLPLLSLAYLFGLVSYAVAFPVSVILNSSAEMDITKPAEDFHAWILGKRHTTA